MGVYTEYFQKSKVFLYPLLQIKKGIAHVPIQTYVAWDNVYSPNDLKFFCEYKTKKTRLFEKFAKDYLLGHPLFEEAIELNEDTQLFIYDFSEYKTDFKKFLEGKYSQFTLDSKVNILDFFGNKELISGYVEGFLQPEGVHDEYAKTLAVNVENIQDIYEVCTPPDINKETLVDNNHIIDQLLKNSSIYLTK
jgi:hypothetical protein